MSDGAFKFENDGPAEQQPAGRLQDQVIDAIRTVYDPEIPVNIVELGLIYECDISEDGKAKIEMTVTAPNCPAANELPLQVEMAARGVPGITDVTVELVWTPPWTPDRMSEDAKLQLNMF